MTKRHFCSPNEQRFQNRMAYLQAQSPKSIPKTTNLRKVILFGGAIKRGNFTEQNWKNVVIKNRPSTAQNEIDKVTDSKLSPKLSQQLSLGSNNPFWILSEI